MRNVSKLTYVGSGHVLNSKLVSEICKQLCFCCKIDFKHDQNFSILDTFLKLYIRVYDNTYRAYLHSRMGGTYKCAHNISDQ